MPWTWTSDEILLWIEKRFWIPIFHRGARLGYLGPESSIASITNEDSSWLSFKFLEKLKVFSSQMFPPPCDSSKWHGCPAMVSNILKTSDIFGRWMGLDCVHCRATSTTFSSSSASTHPFSSLSTRTCSLFSWCKVLTCRISKQVNQFYIQFSLLKRRRSIIA